MWNFATILRDSGVSYTEYVAQLSYLLFLKMESERESIGESSKIPASCKWERLIRLDGLELESAYNAALAQLSESVGYDMRTNMNLSLVTSPLSAEHLREFESCFCLGAMENRKESERFRSFGIEEIKQRDKMNLDIFWIKDESLEDLENLPSPKDLSEEICISLKNALKEMSRIEEELN
ncbi:type I restriction-modification system subunit M N-terminal domain-containing protein [uncultured Helicobacter sp.]|uniref:type I restriction-modification system subunit M N-terminal domain-containing protein n=1 Tax=uncultured Helicobacter sp. TaxID=175537 RepID=UPI002629E60F|nr:type I restriction-modification system subunit M N-terminal domain-containing protein [uncultured Helicobacter sp.]